jgi:hypothetical protein
MKHQLPIRRAILVFLVPGLLLALPALSQTTIDFDDAEEGTNIETFYESLGVTFSCDRGIDCVDQFVTVKAPIDSPVIPYSPPNIVTQTYDLQFDGCFDDETAILRATFTNPVDFASIVAVNQIVEDNAFLAAYAADGTELDFHGEIDFSGGYVLLSVQAPDIAYVEFSGWQDDSACFDDLTFGRTVPTLSWIGMIGLAILLALGGLSLVARKATVRH